MLKPAQNIFVRIKSDGLAPPAADPESGSEAETVLHQGLFLAYSEDLFQITLAPSELAITEGDQIILYYHEGNAFMQQLVSVVVAEREDDHLFLDLQCECDASSADSRELFRVTTLSFGIQALVEGTDRCPVRDVSASGLAVVSAKVYSRGQIVSVVVQTGEDSFVGRARIQSIRKLRRDNVRYGLVALADGASLETGLRDLANEIQREQWRRS